MVFQKYWNDSSLIYGLANNKSDVDENESAFISRYRLCASETQFQCLNTTSCSSFIAQEYTPIKCFYINGLYMLTKYENSELNAVDVHFHEIENGEKHLLGSFPSKKDYDIEVNFRNGNVFIVYYNSLFSIRFIDSKPSIQSVNLSKILKHLLFVEQFTYNYGILLVCQEEDRSGCTLQFVLLDKDHKTVSDINIIQEQCFIPQLYSSVVLCAATWCPDASKCLSEKNITYICTDRQQLCVFETGKLVISVKLPFDDAKQIFIFETHSFNKILIIISSAGKVCCIGHSKYQILRSFDHVSDLFVDDFIQTGSQQLLLLFGSHESFALLDFESIDIHSDQKTNVNKEDTSENLQHALSALTSRIQVGKASLNYSEKCLDDRRKLIDLTCDNIKNLNLNLDSTKHSTSDPLYPLLPVNPSRSNESCLNHSGSPSTDPITVKSTWKSVVNDDLVIGAKLQNDTNGKLLHPCLVISPITNHFKTVKSTSSIFLPHLEPIDNQRYAGLPVNKIPKLDPSEYIENQDVKRSNEVDQGCVFYALTSVPLASISESLVMKLPLVLQWDTTNDIMQQIQKSTNTMKQKSSVKRKAEEDKNVTVTTVSNSYVIGIEEINCTELSRFQLQCCLDSSQMNENSVKNMQDYLSLMASQKCTRLTFESSVSSVSRINHLLKEELGFISHWRGTTLIRCERTGMFPHVRVRTTIKERRIATVEVYTKDESQFLLFLRTLYSVMPDDILIKPTTHEPSQQDLNNTASSLQDEIKTSLESIDKAMNQTDGRLDSRICQVKRDVTDKSMLNIVR